MLALSVLCCLISCGTKDAVETTEPVVETPAIVPGEMVFIPAGEFLMGTNDKETPAYPEHKVSLPAFWIDKYEVSNEEFMDFATKNKYAGEGAKEDKDWRLFATIERMSNPVVYITWKDADTYCKAQGKRLPTEEEWEYAARGTNSYLYPWGNEWIASRANTADGGAGIITDIGKYDGDVSPFGVHDMLGNVQEWTASWYKTYKGNPKSDPKSGETIRVIRGLSYIYSGKKGSLANRNAQLPTALNDFGCRCAKNATPEDIAKMAVK